MKLLIDNGLTIVDTVGEEEEEEWQGLYQDFKDLGVALTIEIKDNKVTLYFEAQKIVANEQAINWILYTLYLLGDFSVSYAALGGAGCDLALCLNQNSSEQS